MESVKGKAIKLDRVDDELKLIFVENEYVDEYKEFIIGEMAMKNHQGLVFAIEQLCMTRSPEKFFDKFDRFIVTCTNNNQRVDLNNRSNLLGMKFIDNGKTVFEVDLKFHIALEMRERIIELMGEGTFEETKQ